MSLPLTRRQLLAATAGGLLASPALAQSTSPKPRAEPPFRRGGAIHTMMNWASLRSDGSGRYKARPFDTPRNAFPRALVTDFAASGFDFIRLTLDVGPFIQLKGSDRDALDEKLLHNIGLFHKLGLGVIVDCHPVDQVPAYSPQVILQDLEAPIFADYTAMIGRLAGLIANVRTGRVMLELMNEPTMAHASHHTQVEVWGVAQRTLHDAARRAAPDLPILVTGADYGGISGLTDLDPAPYINSNTLFSFHYYMPISFTHQGIDLGPDGPTSPYVVDLPYPYNAVSAAEIMSGIQRRIESSAKLDASARAAELRRARRIVRGFLGDAWTRRSVTADMTRVADWAATHGIEGQRIFMGECDATRRGKDFTGAKPVYRRRWLSDVTSLAASHGFGWALWEINSKEFGIQSIDDANRIDPMIIKALGMNS